MMLAISMLVILELLGLLGFSLKLDLELRKVS